jgi:hypothetical protein
MASVSRSGSSAEMSTRDWERLLRQARTAEDFHRLAAWCESKSESLREKQKGYEAELRIYLSEPVHRADPKYPRREQTLRLLIAHSHDLAEHWQDLKKLCEAKSSQQR